MLKFLPFHRKYEVYLKNSFNLLGWLEVTYDNWNFWPHDEFKPTQEQQSQITEKLKELQTQYETT